MKSYPVSQYINTNFSSTDPLIGYNPSIAAPVSSLDDRFSELVDFFIRSYTLHLLRKSPEKYNSLHKSVRTKIASLAKIADELAEAIYGDLRYYASLNRQIRNSIHTQFKDEKIWTAVVKNWTIYNHILEGFSTDQEREHYVFSLKCNLLDALHDYLPTIKIKYPLVAKHLNRKIAFRHWLILVLIGNVMMEVMEKEITVDLILEL